MPRSLSQRRTLDPKLDVVFKLLFAAERNRDLLIALLTAVLQPRSPIASADVLNPQIDREDWDDKGAILDIRVRFADGRQVDVEMQAAPHRALRERSLYYWARLYAAELGSGHAYSELMPVIGVFILNFEELPTARLHSIFEARERHEGYYYCRKLPESPPAKLGFWRSFARTGAERTSVREHRKRSETQPEAEIGGRPRSIDFGSSATPSAPPSNYTS